MRRREFITLLGGVALLLAAQAQQTEKKRVGLLMSFAETDASARVMLEGYRTRWRHVPEFHRLDDCVCAISLHPENSHP